MPWKTQFFSELKFQKPFLRDTNIHGCRLNSQCMDSDCYWDFPPTFWTQYVLTGLLISSPLLSMRNRKALTTLPWRLVSPKLLVILSRIASASSLMDSTFSQFQQILILFYFSVFFYSIHWVFAFCAFLWFICFVFFVMLGNAFKYLATYWYLRVSTPFWMKVLWVG